MNYEERRQQNRLAYNKAKAMEHIAKKKPKGNPVKPAIKAEDNRNELHEKESDPYIEE